MKSCLSRSILKVSLWKDVYINNLNRFIWCITTCGLLFIDRLHDFCIDTPTSDKHIHDSNFFYGMARDWNSFLQYVSMCSTELWTILFQVYSCIFIFCTCKSIGLSVFPFSASLLTSLCFQWLNYLVWKVLNQKTKKNKNDMMVINSELVLCFMKGKYDMFMYFPSSCQALKFLGEDSQHQSS